MGEKTVLELAEELVALHKAEKTWAEMTIADLQKQLRTAQESLQSIIEATNIPRPNYTPASLIAQVHGLASAGLHTGR